MFEFLKLNNKIKVLIADDQNVIRNSLKKIFEKDGSFEIFDFNNGDSAINFLKEHNVDLIILDIYMPIKNGFDVLKYLKNRVVASDIPVIFVSGEATKDDIVYAIDQGASDYILKPFDITEFMQKVKNVLNRYFNPSDWEKNLRKAEFLFFENKFEEASNIYKMMLLKENKSHKVIAGLAQCKIKKLNIDMGIKLLEEAVEINNLYFPAYALLADCFIQLKDYVNAKKYLKTELNINGKQPQRRLLLAQIYIQNEDYSLAQEELRKAILDEPKNKDLLLLMGKNFLLQNNKEKALRYYLKTRKNNPDCTEALNKIAEIYITDNNPKKAISFLNDLLKTHPKQKDIHIVKAKVLEYMNDLEESINNLDLYLNYYLDDLEVLKSKFKLLNKLKKHIEAINVIKIILQNEKTSENYAKLGLCYLKINRPSIALKYYEKATQMSPDNVIYKYNFAYTLEITGNIEQAYKNYTNVLHLDVKHKEAIVACQRIDLLKKVS